MYELLRSSKRFWRTLKRGRPMTFAAAERTRASEAFSSETRIVRSCDRRRVREKIEVRACSYLRSHAGARRDELAPFGAGKAESAARGGVAELAGGLFLARRRLRRLRRLQHAGQGRGAAAAGLGQTRRLVTLGEIVALVGARRAFPQRRERRAGTEKQRTEKHRARDTPARAVRCAGFLSPPARRRGPRASRKRVRRKRATLRGRVGRARNVAREPPRSRVLALSVVRCGGTPRARSGLQTSQRRRCVSRARAIRAWRGVRLGASRGRASRSTPFQESRGVDFFWREIRAMRVSYFFIFTEISD